MHKSMKHHLSKAQEINNIVYDIPEMLLSVSAENEVFFDFITLIVDNVYAPMMTTKCLSYTDILDLHYTNARLKDSISDLNKIKMVGVEHYLKNKLEKVLAYAIENELYEIIHNLNMYNKVTMKLQEMYVF